MPQFDYACDLDDDIGDDGDVNDVGDDGGVFLRAACRPTNQLSATTRDAAKFTFMDLRFGNPRYFSRGFSIFVVVWSQFP